MADIYADHGFIEVEAKSGQHHGTYKVFVNFIPVADITQLHSKLFNALQTEAIVKSQIHYAPPNFLRMSMYLELSRPRGDVGRWEKVMKRLTLLNKYYPISSKNCLAVEFQRPMDFSHVSDLSQLSSKSSLSSATDKNKVELETDIYTTALSVLLREGVVFFGGYAMYVYSRYMPKNARRAVEKIPDFDVLSETPKKAADALRHKLEENNFNNVSIIEHANVEEIIPTHYEVRVNMNSVAFIYKPVACHSYNIIHVHGASIKIATIDTMLSMYLAFLYANRSYYNTDRILCMAKWY